MKRILVVDDERPVVDGIALIVGRDLAADFEVVGTASSGKEAIERAPALTPDIVLMDVRMPGISGLDAIRELRRRGSDAAFVLVTAYERFDIAREAVELGVLGYLLKPVARDDLARTLHAASAYLDRLRDLERREVEHREGEARLRGFVESAYLARIMLGEDAPGQAEAREVLGIEEPWACVLAAAFMPAETADAPGSGVRASYLKFRELLRYRSNALVGPLVAGVCPAIVVGRDAAATATRLAELAEVLDRALGAERARGELRLGCGGPRPIAEASGAWEEALADLSAPGLPRNPAPDSARDTARDLAPTGDENRSRRPFEDDEEFLASFRESSPARAVLALERILAPLIANDAVPGPEAGRIASLLAAAARTQARRGSLDPVVARSFLDAGILRAGTEGALFRFEVRARFARLAASIGSESRHSPPLGRAIAWARERYGKMIGLESCAEAVGISPNRLSRLFVEETGKGFSDFLIDFRMEKAREMLLEPGWSIKEVSAACGYPDPNYFSRLFKKVTGLTPSAYAAGDDLDLSRSIPEEKC
ncbi:MAG TPA: hypothetical protein DIC34_00910 [Treponema sp.]|nr:MAG: hypothetical protein A2001_02835 [Treponema sp. GWC1_61_84]OHE70798.1 MAG: hypothetical protein A2413_03475 [Treponema sp. RIFOXYC1_FULL_61_9]HCM25104.1 hypothetical protein [Treponema sp.]